MLFTTALDHLRTKVAEQIVSTKSFLNGELLPDGTLPASAIPRIQQRIDWIKLTLDEQITACELARSEMPEQIEGSLANAANAAIGALGAGISTQPGTGRAIGGGDY